MRLASHSTTVPAWETSGGRGCSPAGRIAAVNEQHPLSRAELTSRLGMYPSGRAHSPPGCFARRAPPTARRSPVALGCQATWISLDVRRTLAGVFGRSRWPHFSNRFGRAGRSGSRALGHSPRTTALAACARTLWVSSPTAPTPGPPTRPGGRDGRARPDREWSRDRDLAASPIWPGSPGTGPVGDDGSFSPTTRFSAGSSKTCPPIHSPVRQCPLAPTTPDPAAPHQHRGQPLPHPFAINQDIHPGANQVPHRTHQRRTIHGTSHALPTETGAGPLMLTWAMCDSARGVKGRRFQPV